ncbi:MAG: phosphotransferase, partial [Candidatus Bipolaricaulota bacterium]
HPSDPREHARLHDLAGVLRDVMEALGEEESATGAIHGELDRRHALFHEDEMRAIGFDRCRWGYFLYDLSVTSVDLASVDPDGTLLGPLLEGYHTVRPLPADAERLIDLFAILRHLLCVDRLNGIADGASVAAREHRHALHALLERGLGA